MVKMNNARGGYRGKQKPRPLFPPGELPLFGPPPAFIRRPHGPPARGPIRPYPEFGPPPPPPPPPRPPHLGPPIPPMHPMNMRRRPGPPPPMPLLQAPVMPPRHLPFMRGRPRPMLPRLGPGRKFGPKNMRKGKPKKNKKPNTSQTKTEESKKPEEKKEENVLEGPWISDDIKAEIEKMNELKKTSETTKAEEDMKLFNEQKEKVQSMASSAKLEYNGSQTENKPTESVSEKNGGTEEKK